MSCLRCLRLLAYSGVQHIVCRVVVLFFLRLVRLVLPVSLYCLFLVAPSVFFNVYSLDYWSTEHYLRFKAFIASVIFLHKLCLIGVKEKDWQGEEHILFSWGREWLFVTNHAILTGQNKENERFGTLMDIIRRTTTRLVACLIDLCIASSVQYSSLNWMVPTIFFMFSISLKSKMYVKIGPKLCMNNELRDTNSSELLVLLVILSI